MVGCSKLFKDSKTNSDMFVAAKNFFPSNFEVQLTNFRYQFFALLDHFALFGITDSIVKCYIWLDKWWKCHIKKVPKSEIRFFCKVCQLCPSVVPAEIKPNRHHKCASNFEGRSRASPNYGEGGSNMELPVKSIVVIPLEPKTFLPRPKFAYGTFFRDINWILLTWKRVKKTWQITPLLAHASGRFQIYCRLKWKHTLELFRMNYFFNFAGSWSYRRMVTNWWVLSLLIQCLKVRGTKQSQALRLLSVLRENDFLFESGDAVSKFKLTKLRKSILI